MMFFRKMQLNFIGCMAIGLLGLGTGLAQNTNSGDLRGTVTDATGAIIPEVSVEVKDVDKGVMHTYVTDAAGLYDTGSIVPDHYVITFTKQDFSTFVRGPITLPVGTSTVNAEMQVGATQQTVVVNTDLPLLTTESGAQEGTLSSQTMAALPQVGADWENFIIMMPGAAGTPENATNSSNPGQIASINGNLPFESMLADGATTTLPMSQNSDVTIFETTAEVKVSTSAFSAQYGVGNIVYNQITKGGTETFHGAGYEYFQNDALNAAPYGFGTDAKVPPLRYNNFGVAIGGPIYKNKMFFYFDFDKTINNTTGNDFATVPTPAMMSGDFTAPGLPTLYDPTTQTIQTTGTYTYTGPEYPGGTQTVTCPCVLRQSFASEYGNGNRIPTGMISSVAKNLQAYFPAANEPGQVSSGVAQNNFFYQSPSTEPFTKYFGRLDYDLTAFNRLTVSETESDNPGVVIGQNICPINCETEDVGRNNAQVSDVWTFSSNLINEARLGFTDQLNFFTPESVNENYPQKLGWQFAESNMFPNLGINNFMNLANGTTLPFVYKEFVFDPSDVVTYIHGRHVLHFGGEFLINRADSTQYGNLNGGTINYSGVYTAQGGGETNSLNGNSYADFLLGQTQSWNALVTPEYGGRNKSPQVFIQDDFKMRPNLTINMGLRYEIQTGWSEVTGNEASFDPTVINPATETPGAMWYGFSHANGRYNLIAPKYHILLPRIGFSYQPKPNTVIRGGFGTYASTWSLDTYGAGMGAALGSSGSLSDQTNGMCSVVSLDSNGSTPDTRDPGCGVGSYNATSVSAAYLTAPTTANAFNGQNVNYDEYHTPVPTNYQYNLSLQRTFGADYEGEVTYVGNHGKNLNFPVDMNQVPENELGPNDLGDRPYPIFNNISGSTNNGISNYNALQAQITKRMSHGLEFNANYTWSHFLDDQDSSGWGARGGWQNYQNAFDPSANYSNSNFDIRNMFKAHFVYQLPVGKGKMFLNNSRLLDEVVGGWQASAVIIAQGGNPVSITTGANNSSNNQSGSSTQYANLVGNIKLTGQSMQQRLLEWYNLSALAVPQAYTYGDFKRNTVYGPGLSEVNFSLGKVFDVWPERGVKFQLRADATNVLNHPSFGQPGNNAIGQGESAQITSTTVGGRAMQLYGRISF